MKTPFCVLFAAALFAVLFLACTTAPESDSDRKQLRLDAEQAVALFQSKPQLQRFFDTAYGYAVFPTIGKGGLIAGGAYGKGVAYEKGQRIGYCDMTQGTVGLQLGGQSYREIVFFQTKEILDAFRRNEFTFSANASAVAVEAGASTAADYREGVAVFTMAIGGLMGEASLGGQNFTFVSSTF